MGFFSQTCSYCDKSIISQYSASAVNEWMMYAVVITPDLQLFRGEYDGYGRLIRQNGGETEDAIGFDNEVYHSRCWPLAGSPTQFTKASKHAPDQGFFFDDEEMAFGSPDDAKLGNAIPSMFDRMTTSAVDDEAGA